MKDRYVIDLGRIFDEIFETAENFKNAVEDSFPFGKNQSGSDMDFYPAHNYPPANIYLDQERTLVFEFALAGFKESDISLKFQGDYLVLTAESTVESNTQEEKNYFKHRLKIKPIKDQKYYVPAIRFDQGKVTAQYTHGLLTVKIPALSNQESPEDIDIPISN